MQPDFAILAAMAARKDSFHGRFNIDISLEEARKKFVARAHNRIFDEFYQKHPESQSDMIRAVGDALGKVPNWLTRSLSRQVGDDFNDVLMAIEGMYLSHSSSEQGELSGLVDYLFLWSEVDLGIRWVPPHFQRAGAEELDRVLVNDTLDWLRKEGYEAVVSPFEKGLRHLMESQKRPELRGDVITEMYEALEALAKKATGKDLDLVKNTGFIDAVKASNEYKTILTNYINYANRFRHAVKEKQTRPDLTERETESFVYLTGLFIRLAMPE